MKGNNAKDLNKAQTTVMSAIQFVKSQQDDIMSIFET